MSVLNKREDVIKGLDRQLMETYAVELICLVQGAYESSFWYAAKREGIHKQLTAILQQDQIDN